MMAIEKERMRQHALKALILSNSASLKRPLTSPFTFLFSPTVLLVPFH